MTSVPTIEAKTSTRQVDRAKLGRRATIAIRIEPEYLPIEGNASAVDPVTDAFTCAWIRRELDSGNAWAWCHVIVTARYAGFQGRDALGMCSYESEEAFKRDGYYSDMVATAIEELAQHLETADVAIAAVMACDLHAPEGM